MIQQLETQGLQMAKEKQDYFGILVIFLKLFLVQVFS